MRMCDMRRDEPAPMDCRGRISSVKRTCQALRADGSEDFLALTVGLCYPEAERGRLRRREPWA